MIVVAIMAGLVPIPCGSMALAPTSPMIGEMVFSTVLMLIVIPAVYALGTRGKGRPGNGGVMQSVLAGGFLAFFAFHRI